MPKFTFVVLSNPVPGRDEVFNDWYTHTHVPEVLQVPGILSAQRFRRTASQRQPGPQPYEYLALYACEAEDPADVTRELLARRASMTLSDAIAQERISCYFEPITPVILAAPADPPTRWIPPLDAHHSDSPLDARGSAA